MNTSSSQLKKTIGMPQAVALYISAVLGSGVLIVPGLAAELAGPASLLAWGGMVLLILPLALSMGLLSARYPDAGGVSRFVTLAFGQRAGAAVGWFFLMSVPIGAPVAALTGAGYMTAALGLGEGYRTAIAALMLAAGLIINIVGMQVAGKVQIGVVLAIIIVLVMAFVFAIPNTQSIHFTPFVPSGWVSAGQAGAILFWCFIGWEAVSHLSEEFTDPRKAAIKGVTIAAIIVGVGIYGSGLVSLTTLIQLPNATFILTYLGGCAAGIRLLKGSRTGVTISWISFVATAIVFPFAGWAVLYPVVIVVLYGLISRKRQHNI